NEPVPLVQGLHDHVSPEAFVEVRRGGKVSGDVNRGLLNRRLRDVHQRVWLDDAVSDVQMWLLVRTSGECGVLHTVEQTEKLDKGASNTLPAHLHRRGPIRLAPLFHSWPAPSGRPTSQGGCAAHPAPQRCAGLLPLDPLAFPHIVRPFRAFYVLGWMRS